MAAGLPQRLLLKGETNAVIRAFAMPFVLSISFRGKSFQYRKALGDIVYKAMSMYQLPSMNNSQAFTEHSPE